MGIKGLTEPRRRVLSIALLENAAFKYGYDRIDEYPDCEGNEWGTQEEEE